MLKTYKLSFTDLYWDCIVEIDEDFVIEKYSKPDQPFTTKDAIKEMVEFWAWWEDRLESNEGDYTKTFLQHLAKTSMLDVISENHNLYGVVSSFEDNEGWYPMDGTHGIKITLVDDIGFSDSEFEVKEVKS